MSDTVLVALITNLCTLVMTIVIALVGRYKLEKIDKLVNGQSTAQLEKIDRQSILIQQLLAGAPARRADDPALGIGIQRKGPG